MIKNILVPYDFTNFSELAFQKAIEIAKKFDSKLNLLTVIGSDIDTSGMDWVRSQEAHDETEVKSKEDLGKIKDSKGENVNISVNIIHDPSATSGILLFAEKNNIDLIVIGSHGRSGFKKLILGSVASGVMTKSICPVLLVKPLKK
ncbi:MAG: universal stress protein [Nitrosopumilus sp.]|nr:universal stress protein [Nitrosopumilus sp.]MDH3384451.1 universal stress protein [Nitrosopumilus sp.]